MNQQPMKAFNHYSTDYAAQYNQIYRSQYEDIKNQDYNADQWINLLGDSIVLNTPPPIKKAEFEIQMNKKEQFNDNINKLYEADSSDNYKSQLKDQRKIFLDFHTDLMKTIGKDDPNEAIKYLPGFPQSPKYHDPFSKLLVIMKRLKKTPYYKDLPLGEKLRALLNPRYLFQASKPHLGAPVELDAGAKNKIQNRISVLSVKLANLPKDASPEYIEDLQKKIEALQTKVKFVPEQIKKRVYSSSTRRDIVDLIGTRKGVDLQNESESYMVKKKQVVDLTNEQSLQTSTTNAMQQLRNLEFSIPAKINQAIFDAPINDNLEVIRSSISLTSMRDNNISNAYEKISETWNYLKNSAGADIGPLSAYLYVIKEPMSINEALKKVSLYKTWSNGLSQNADANLLLRMKQQPIYIEQKALLAKIIKSLMLLNIYRLASQAYPEIQMVLLDKKISASEFINLVPVSEMQEEVMGNSRRRRLVQLGQPDDFDPNSTVTPDFYGYYSSDIIPTQIQMADNPNNMQNNNDLMIVEPVMDDMQLPASIDVP